MFTNPADDPRSGVHSQNFHDFSIPWFEELMMHQQQVN